MPICPTNSPGGLSCFWFRFNFNSVHRQRIGLSFFLPRARARAPVIATVIHIRDTYVSLFLLKRARLRQSMYCVSCIKKKKREKDSLNSQRYGCGARRKMMRALERSSDAKRRSSAARECHGVDYGWRERKSPCPFSRLSLSASP